MNIILILFAISLLSIMVMIGRKLMLLRRGLITAEYSEEIIFEIPYINEVKTITIKNAKRYGYLGLVATIRLYFRSAGLAKSTYLEAKEKTKNLIEKNKRALLKDKSENSEISGFLRTISEYKEKISALKHRIREEEKKL